MNNIIKFSKGRSLILLSIFYLLSFQKVFGAGSGMGSVTGEGASSTGGGKLLNPIKFDSLTDFIAAILKLVVKIGLPVAIFFIILSGFGMVAARGNPAKIGIARQAFVGALIGLAILLGAQVLASAIGETINELSR